MRRESSTKSEEDAFTKLDRNHLRRRLGRPLNLISQSPADLNNAILPERKLSTWWSAISEKELVAVIRFEWPRTKASNSRAVPFILTKQRAKHLLLSTTHKFQPAEIFKTATLAAAKNFDPFLGIRFVTIRQVADSSLRTVGKAQRTDQIVVAVPAWI